MNLIFEKKLKKAKLENNYRELKLAKGIDFSSNDYLGLANHPKIKEAVVNAINSGTSIGSGGSRLLTGNKKEHRILEEFAADYFNTESCLFFSSGFLANYAVFSTLPQRKDFIIYDELIHASIRDGIKSSDAKSIKFKHNDLKSLKEKIEQAKSLNANSIWLGIESVYSMDGDTADIAGILELIKNYRNIYLIIDEAHATGIFGQDGKGFSYTKVHSKPDSNQKSRLGLLPQQQEASYALNAPWHNNINYENLITIHTCGKALGVSGALVCASKGIIDYLINTSRPFIYTTAESPLIAVAVKEALIISQEESWRREKLFEFIEYTHNNYQDVLDLNYRTQIIPIILNDSMKALQTSSFLQLNGFDVRAVRPPAVPSARLRISLNANRKKEEIDRLFEQVSKWQTVISK